MDCLLPAHRASRPLHSPLKNLTLIISPLLPHPLLPSPHSTSSPPLSQTSEGGRTGEHFKRWTRWRRRQRLLHAELKRQRQLCRGLRWPNQKRLARTGMGSTAAAFSDPRRLDLATTPLRGHGSNSGGLGLVGFVTDTHWNDRLTQSVDWWR